MQPLLFEEDPEIPEDLVLALLKVRLLEDASCDWHERGISVSSRLAAFWNKVCLYLCEPIDRLLLYPLGGSSRFQLSVVSVLLTFFFTLLEVKQFCQPPWLAPGCASCHQMLLSVGRDLLLHQMQKQKMW